MYGDEQRCRVRMRRKKLKIGARTSETEMDEVWREGTFELADPLLEFHHQMDISVRKRGPKGESIDWNPFVGPGIREVEAAVSCQDDKLIAALREGWK